jgi:acyl-CoA reductase-like NAD-dependent aldehyde dehydrogenase
LQLCSARHFGLQKLTFSNIAMSSTSQTSVEAIAQAAKTAFEASQLLPSSVRETALRIIADQLEKNKDAILQANREDMKVLHVIELSCFGCLTRSQ